MQCHARLAGAVLFLAERPGTRRDASPAQSWAADAGPLRPGGSRYPCARRAARVAAVAAAAGQRHREERDGPVGALAPRRLRGRREGGRGDGKPGRRARTRPEPQPEAS